MLLMAQSKGNDAADLKQIRSTSMSQVEWGHRIHSVNFTLRLET